MRRSEYWARFLGLAQLLQESVGTGRFGLTRQKGIGSWTSSTWRLTAGAYSATELVRSIKKLALSSAIILVPFCALAQHKSGEYVIDRIMSADREGVQPGLAILRGSLAGHDALADELGRIIVEGTSRQAFLAGEILRLSANSAGERGEPYLRARYVLRGAYEELWGKDNLRARSVITDLVLAGDENYVRDRFEASQKPAKACRNNPESRCPYNASEWCAIGRELVYIALRFPQALSEPAPSPEKVLPHCFGSIKEDGVWLHVVY